MYLEVSHVVFYLALFPMVIYFNRPLFRTPNVLSYVFFSLFHETQLSSFFEEFSNFPGENQNPLFSRSLGAFA